MLHADYGDLAVTVVSTNTQVPDSITATPQTCCRLRIYSSTIYYARQP